MTQLSPVEGNPFAAKSGPALKPVGYNPFETAAPSFDGGAAVRSVFPEVRINSQHRGPGGVGPSDDWHHRSNAAVDVAPIKGMTFNQFTDRLQAVGYPIIQAIDEVNHPSKWSTGPHWHVVIGARKGGPRLASVDYDPFAGGGKLTPVDHDPFKSPQRRAGAKRSPSSPQRPNPSQRAGNQAAGPNWSDLPGNIIPSAKRTAKGIFEAVRHPIDTIEGVGETVGGAGLAAMDAISRRVEGKDFATGPKAKELARRFHEQADPWLQHPLRQLKKDLIEDPVGTALTVAPVAGGARIAGKLGVRGVEAARLAGLSPEERAALKASRAEDAAHAKRYGALQREVVGRHSLDRDRAIASMQKHQRVVGNAPVEHQRAIVSAVESASKGGIAKLPEEYQPAARTLRNVAQTYEAKIKDVMKRSDGSGPSFIKDYYAHLWKRDGKANAFFSGKQGSGRNLKGRRIMTLQEGLAAGLKPVHENPIDQMTAYVDSMSKYLQAHDLQNRMRRTGLAKWVPEHSIPDGWHKLEGINTTRDAIHIPGDVEKDTLDRNIGRRVLAAPRKAAVMYNRFVDPGLEQNLRRSGYTGAANAYKAARGVTSAASNILLSFSGFHPTLVAGKAVASDLGNAITHTFRGEPAKALKSIANAPIAPIRPLIDRLAGKVSMKGRLLSGDEALTQIDKLWRDAGGRLQSGSEYHASLRPNLLTSALRGTFKRDVSDMAKNIFGKDASLRERVGATADAVGRTLDSMSSAIFDHFVPAMKRQAFEREMAASLKPGMDEAEQKALARHVMDNVSGRMGELERDNIFWGQWQTDLARLLILSPSWQYGDYKVLTDAAKGMKMGGHGVAQAVALVGSQFLMNGIANYLHTGQMPQGEDWIAYRTGGTTTDRSGVHPERAMVASIMKDFYNIPEDPLGEAANKMTPIPRSLMEVARNTDWRDQPIYRPMALGREDLPQNAPESMKEPRGLAALAHVAEALNPIGFQPNPNGANSGISTAGHILFGERPVGQRFYDPEGYKESQKYFAKKRVQGLIRAEQRDAARKRKR